MKTRAGQKNKRKSVKVAKKSTKNKITMALKTNLSAAAKKNEAAHWKTYRELEKKAEKALATFRSNLKKKASPKTLLENKNALLLLLGECNYMARQCMRASQFS